MPLDYCPQLKCAELGSSGGLQNTKHCHGSAVSRSACSESVFVVLYVWVSKICPVIRITFISRDTLWWAGGQDHYLLLKCCSFGLKLSSNSSSQFILQTFYYFQCFVEQNWFHLIGIICGLAIYNSTVVDLPFPLALYKKLLDVSPTLEDLKELSPTEARSHDLHLGFGMRSR